MRIVVFAFAIWTFACQAAAQEFFAGKTIEIVVSTGVGGSLDLNARLVARHLSGHIPGIPDVVVRNMPGAGHVRAASYLFNQAARDGTSIGTLVPVFVLTQVLDSREMSFDASRFQWLGSTASSNSTVYVTGASAVTSVEEARHKSVLMGATASGSYSTLYPIVMNNVLGTKFHVLTGYPGSTAINMAIERGEVSGRAGNSVNSLFIETADWLPSGKIRLLAQIGRVPDRAIPDVPLLASLARNDDERELLEMFSADVAIGRPFLTPPDVPPDRVDILREALRQVVRDPAFLLEARIAGLDVNFSDGASIQAIVDRLVHASPDLIARAKAARQARDFVERIRHRHRELIR